MTAIRTWLDRSVLQVAAESYLETIDLDKQGHPTVRIALENQLTIGANNFGKNPIAKSDPNKAVKSRLTSVQAEWLVANYTIVDHLPNTASGFSATVFRHNQSGTYTLSFRSTESKFGEHDAGPDEGGDWARDGRPGADGEISEKGFAFGQLADAQRYFAHLRAGRSLNAHSGQWENTARLAALRDHLAADGTIEVTGYSLGGHLAQAFALMHPDRVSATWIFNAAGLGGIRDGIGAAGFDAPDGSDITALLSIYEEMRTFDGSPPPEPQHWFDRPEVDRPRLQQLVAAHVPDDNLYDDALHRYIVDFLERFTFPAGIDLAGRGLGLNQLRDAHQNFVASGFDPDAFMSSLYETDTPNIHSLYGHSNAFDPEFVANSGYHQRADNIWIEHQPLFSGDGWLGLVNSSLRPHVGNFGETHSIALIVDSLAGLDLLQAIDPTYTSADWRALGRSSTDTVVTLDRNRVTELILSEIRGLPLIPMETLIQVANPNLEEPDAQERIVNALAQLFTGSSPGLEAELKAGGFGHIDRRNALHEAIATVRDVVDAGNVSRRLVNLIDIPAASLAQLAGMPGADGIAYRYALVNLNPFVVLGDPVLYGRHNVADVNGTGALERARFSDAWISDRAIFLEWTLKRNADNAHRVDAGFSAGFRDLVSGDGVMLTTRNAVAPVAHTTVLFATPGDDEAGVADGTEHVDRIYAGPGADRIRSFGGDDYIEGNEGDDDLFAGAGADVVRGGDGNDFLYANDALNENDRARDELYGGAGFDRYVTHDGDVVSDSDGRGEVIVGTTGGGRVSLTGEYRAVGDGVWRNDAADIALYRRGADAMAVALGTAGPVRVLLKDFDTGLAAPGLGIVLRDGSVPGADIVGTALNDRLDHDPATEHAALVGSAGADVIDALEGDDDVFGGTGNDPWGGDYLFGGPGDDYLASAAFGPHDDIAQVPGDAGDVLDGGDGNDVVVGHSGDDRLTGGGGDDFLSGRGGTDLFDGGAGNDVLSGGTGADTLSGGSGDDVLYGDFDVFGLPTREHTHQRIIIDGRVVDIAHSGVLTAAASALDADDYLFGGAGADFLNGHDGNDWLDGGAGNDSVFGWRGDDDIRGGDGNDFLAGDDFGQLAGLIPGNDRIHAGAGDDEVFGDGGDDRLFGEAGDDDLHGNRGDDHLYGGDGHDALDGGEGHDLLSGGAGDDRLAGAAGDDTLAGDGGNDLLLGGAGDDVYIYRAGDGHDRIEDSAGFDEVVLEAIALSQLVVSQAGSDITFHLDPGNSLTIAGWANGDIEKLVGFGEFLAGGANKTPAGAGGIHAAAELPSPAQLPGDDLVMVDVAGTFSAGAGDDHYRVQVAGDVSLTDEQGRNTVELPPAFSPANLNAVEANGVITLVGAAGDVRLSRSGLHEVVFADGTRLSGDALSRRARHAPEVRHAMPHQSAFIGVPFQFSLEDELFGDADAGDAITLTAQRTDGGSLPAWLAFEPAGGRFSGRAPAAAVGGVDIMVTATDDTGLSASTTFSLDVIPPVTGANAALFDVDDIDGANGFFVTAPLVPGGTVNDGLVAGALPALTHGNAPLAVAAGDVNGDGISDFVLAGVPGDYGGAYVIFGETEPGAPLDPATLRGVRGFAIHGFGVQPNADFEHSIFGLPHGIGDINGDGFDDISIGLDVELFEEGGEGAVGIVYGGNGHDGRLDLLDLDGSNGFIVQTGEIWTAYQHEIAGYFAGDINDDGIDDVLVDRSNRAGQFVIYGARAFGAELSAGTPVDDTIFVDRAHDVHGGGGDDRIYVGASGRFLVTTGSGNNLVSFGAGPGQSSAPRFASGSRIEVRGSGGADRYVIDRRNGPVEIVLRDPFVDGDPAGIAAANRARLVGWDSNDVRIGIGSLQLAFADDEPELHLESFNPDDVYGGPRDVAVFEFDDGELSFGQLLARGFDIDGTDGDDDLRGTNIHDRFHASPGDDRLAGGSGDDTYFYAAGAGHDRISDSGGSDLLVIDASLEIASFQPGDTNTDLVLSMSDGGSLTIADWYTEPAARVEFVVVGNRTPVRLEEHVNHAPAAIAAGHSARIVPGATWTIDTTAMFRDTDPGDRVSTGLRFDTAMPPAWLRLDSDGMLTARPAARDAGAYRFTLVGTDSFGRSAETTLFVEVVPPPTAVLLGDGRDVYWSRSPAPVYGEGGNDVIIGHRRGGALYGGAGADRLHARRSGNYLDGGTGDDKLFGHSGNDTFFVADDGSTDTLRERGGIDTLAFGSGIEADDLVTGNNGTDLVLTFGSSGLRVAGWYASASRRVEWFSFADGTTKAAVDVINRAPRATDVEVITVASGQALMFDVAGELFLDPDPRARLSVEIAATNAEVLPAWLQWDPLAATLAGIPAVSDEGSRLLQVRATDEHGATHERNVVLTVTPGAETDAATMTSPAGSDATHQPASARDIPAGTMPGQFAEASAKLAVPDAHATLATAVANGRVFDALAQATLMAQAMGAFSITSSAHDAGLRSWMPTGEGYEAVLAAVS